jgi:hypothetical protein
MNKDAELLLFLYNKCRDEYDEDENQSWMISLAELTARLEDEGDVPEPTNPVTQELPRSILWREVAAAATRNGNDRFAVKVANAVLEEYDTIFETKTYQE